MFVSDGSIQLSIVLEKPEGAGRCPLVILLHGFTSAKDRPHTILAAEAMRKAGFATIRMDLYGHGESGGAFRDHTIRKWVSNVMAVAGYARSLDFVTDIYLSGHSQGGLVAALAAGAEPDRFAGLILRAPAFMIPQGAREGCLLGYHFDPKHVPESVPLYDGLELGGGYIRDAQAIDAEEAVRRFKGPVLILHGDLDDTVPVEESVRAASGYARCELEVIAGETHHFDRHPEEMMRLIQNYCNKHR